METVIHSGLASSMETEIVYIEPSSDTKQLSTKFQKSTQDLKSITR